jgi:hypothetical protein
MPAFGAIGTAAEAGESLLLRGTNIISADQPAVLRVTVPPGSILDSRQLLFRRQGPNKALSFRGRGAFVGLILQKEESDQGPPFRFVAGRFDSCVNRCRGTEVFNYVSPREGEVDIVTGEPIPRWLEVPPGEYRLYLVSGGGPVRARLVLKGLAGTLTQTATEPANVDAGAMPTRVDIDGNLWAAGSTFSSGDRGVLISNMFIEAQEIRNLRFGICAPNGPIAPPEDVSYGPHCTALSLALGANFYGTLPRPDLDNGYFVVRFQTNYSERHLPPNPTGERGLGAWFSTDSPVKSAGAQGVFVSFD